jgi:hypothetical protein
MNPIFVNEFGKVTLEVKYVGLPYKREVTKENKDVLEVKAVALGAMPVSLWIRPLELYRTIKMIQPGTIGRVLGMVFAGRKAYNKAKKAERQAEKNAGS